MALVLLPFNKCASNELRIKNEKSIPLPKRHILKAYRDVKVQCHILLFSEMCVSTSKLWDRVPSTRWNGGLVDPTTVLFPYWERVGQADSRMLRPWILHGYISVTEAITVLVSTA
jgi:hypothetical protein